MKYKVCSFRAHLWGQKITKTHLNTFEFVFLRFLTDHETAIMHRLQEVILEHASSLLTVVELTAELDW